MPESKQTKIESIGEFGLIDRLAKILDSSDSKVIKGIGDDAAAIEIDEERCLLVSTDNLVEGVHFDLSYMPLKHLGYKSVVVCISDIAAMNGIPEYITLSIGISSKFSVEAIEEFYRGVNEACKTYKVDLVGGDTSGSPKGLFINVTSFGIAKKSDVSYRSGCKDKDVVCVSGDLGGAYLGMHVLEREKLEFQANPEKQPELDDFSYVVGKQLRPEARTDLVHSFRELGIIPHSLIDISDGLASEILHLAKRSNMNLQVFDEKIPMDEETRNACMEFNLDPTMAAMNGGEDYELLMTLSLEDYEKVKNHPDLTAIGFVQAGKGAILIGRSGTKTEITAQGWNHF